MKQINNNFAEYYYLTKEGKIYNSNTNKYLKENDKRVYKLKNKNGIYKAITLRKLYKLVYKVNFCIDKIENLENEEWKAIEGTEQLYYVSNKGRIKSKTSYEARILKPTLTKNGYYRLDIIIEGQRQSKLVHRLVADAFIDKPKQIDYVLHHKDFNKLNNSAENLEWLSNATHAKKHTRRNKER